MTKTRQVLALATLAAAPMAVWSSVAGAQATDDGPCPHGTVGELPAGMYAEGVDYRDGVWTDGTGHSFGVSAEEDECIVVISDDLDPSPWMPALRALAGLSARAETHIAETPRIVAASDPTGAGLPVTL